MHKIDWTVKCNRRDVIYILGKDQLLKHTMGNIFDCLKPRVEDSLLPNDHREYTKISPERQITRPIGSIHRKSRNKEGKSTLITLEFQKIKHRITTENREELMRHFFIKQLEILEPNSLEFHSCLKAYHNLKFKRNEKFYDPIISC